MPVLKSSLSWLSPTKLYGGPVTPRKELILGGSMNGGLNPFEEDEETNPFAEDLSQEKNPFGEEEEQEEGNAAVELESPNGFQQSANGPSPKTIIGEKAVTIRSSLRKVWVKGKKKVRSPTEDKSPEKKSFFRLPSPPSSPADQDPPGNSAEKGKGRRPSDELASPAKPGAVGSPDKEAPPPDTEPRKRLAFLKRGRGKPESLPEKPEAAGGAEKAAEPVATVKEPLSVLEIHERIKKRELVTAGSHIIELEEECERVRQQSSEGDNPSKDRGRKARDVTLLYEALEGELRNIVAESLEEARPASQLEQVVKAIEREEQADQTCRGRQAESGSGYAGRPRELRRKWREAVKGSVAARLLRSQGSGDGPIAQRLSGLKEQTVADLITVRKNIMSAYPKEYDAFNVYVRSYHEGVSSCLSEMCQKELEIQELYTFLQWCHNIYFREVMGHEELAAHIRKQQLGPLLPAETVQRLEDESVAMVKTQIAKGMERELAAEQERWKQEATTFQSEMGNRVIQLLKEHVENSAAITEELGSRIADCCLRSLADFLQSFQTSAQGFYERCSENTASTEWLVPQTIAVVNCCPAFRDYIERLTQKVSTDGEEMKKKATASLDKVVRGGNRLLMERLFDELKPSFSKLLKKKWLQSKESFESVVSTIQQYFNQFRKMKSPPYQVLVNNIHVRVVTGYLTAVLQVRITCSSAEMRTKVAGRLSEESTQLKELFKSLDSTMSWLDPAIDHLAEIIKLKETSSIQMEVGVMVGSYPDVRKKHIAAVLNVRGDVSQANRQNILETLQDFDGGESSQGPSRDRALFAEIDVLAEMWCVNLDASCTAGCFSVFRRRSICAR
uniref:exocyst complex component 3 n=1 Tax=Pristiophorus japonicus TaxID=55135 RepID=UPI00398E34FA